MHWKRWPYWFKIAILLAGFVVLSLGSLGLCENLLGPSGDDGLGGFVCMPFALIFLPFWFTPLVSLPEGIYIVSALIIWFVVGGCVGGVINYWKSKKKSSR